MLITDLIFLKGIKNVTHSLRLCGNVWLFFRVMRFIAQLINQEQYSCATSNRVVRVKDIAYIWRSSYRRQNDKNIYTTSIQANSDMQNPELKFSNYTTTRQQVTMIWEYLIFRRKHDNFKNGCCLLITFLLIVRKQSNSMYFEEKVEKYFNTYIHNIAFAFQLVLLWHFGPLCY